MLKNTFFICLKAFLLENVHFTMIYFICGNHFPPCRYFTLKNSDGRLITRPGSLHRRNKKAVSGTTRPRPAGKHENGHNSIIYRKEGKRKNMKCTNNLSNIEKRAARILNVNYNDLKFITRTSYGDVYSLNDGRVLVDGLFYDYSRRDIYRALLRKLLNRYGIVHDSSAAYLEYVKAKI